jgi:hypothetical protein
MPCGWLYGLFPLTKSEFSSIEPKPHSGSTRTSCPVSSSARTLISLDAAIPSPATALAVGSFAGGDRELTLNALGGDTAVFS